MRTSINLPDLLLREIKAKTAMDGVTLTELMLSLVERGLRTSSESNVTGTTRRQLRCLDIKKPISKLDFSNAGLFDLVNDSTR